MAVCAQNSVHVVAEHKFSLALDVGAGNHYLGVIASRPPLLLPDQSSTALRPVPSLVLEIPVLWACPGQGYMHARC